MSNQANDDDKARAFEAEYQEFYRATGELVREWAEFELILSWPISALLATDEFRARVTVGSLRGFNSKLKLIRDLSATFAEDESHSRLSQILDRAARMASNRNMLAHWLGGVDSKPGGLVFVADAPDKELGINFIGERKIDINNVRDWSKSVAEMRGELMKLFSAGGGFRVHRAPRMHRVTSESKSE